MRAAAELRGVHVTPFVVGLGSAQEDHVSLAEGVSRFLDWYADYYHVNIPKKRHRRPRRLSRE